MVRQHQEVPLKVCLLQPLRTPHRAGDWGRNELVQRFTVSWITV